MSEKDYQNIEEYLDGTLSKAERAAVEQQLGNDKQFAAEFASQQLMHQELGNAQKVDLWNKLEGLKTEFPIAENVETEPVNAQTNPSNNWWKYGVAILVIAAIFYFWKGRNIDKEISKSPIIETNNNAQQIDNQKDTIAKKNK